MAIRSPFWESNGPIFVPRALAVVEQEFRETLALSYLLLRLGWPTYRRGPGPASSFARFGRPEIIFRAAGRSWCRLALMAAVLARRCQPTKRFSAHFVAGVPPSGRCERRLRLAELEVLVF
jgi:hypothetical protein